MWYRFPISTLTVLLAFGCDAGTSSTPEKPKNEFAVRVNSVGYLPERMKQATFDGGDGSFTIKRSDGSVAYQGMASSPVPNTETGEMALRIADFSGFRAPGEYYLEAPGVGRSPSFRIGGDIYVDVMKALMQGMQGQRCGAEVSLSHAGNTFEHGACHLDDAWLDLFGDESSKKPTLYGWHDAGDYGKYTINGAFSVGMMLFAWDNFQDRLRGLELEIPEHGGALPDFLAECRFELDWLLSMQLEDGSVADRVSTARFDGTVSPEGSTGRRRLSPASTAATSYFVGAMARAARAVEPFDAELATSYREAAERGWAYLTDQPTDIVPDASVQHQFTGSYWNAGRGGRNWAAIELWETTGEDAALASYEQNATNAGVDAYWDYDDISNLGVFTYLASQRDGKDSTLVDRLSTRLRQSVTNIVANQRVHPYGRALGTQYTWGTNGILARTALNVGALDVLQPEDADLDAISLSVDHLLGRNFYGRSYVTGVGYLPPLNPHHRPSQADSSSTPWPGLLVGGPWSDQTGQLAATAWKDQSDDFRTNEVAINWNAAMIYAVAALLPRE